MKLKLIFVIIGIVTALTLAYFFIGAGPGETIGNKGVWSFCRQGLTVVGGHPGGFSGNCDDLPPPTGLHRCTNCGNRICDTQNGENKCNCPTDCRN